MESMRLQLWNVVEIFLAEVFASAFFMFFGCMSLITGFSNRPIVPLEAGFAFAFVISSIIVVRAKKTTFLLRKCVAKLN